MEYVKNKFILEQKREYELIVLCQIRWYNFSDLVFFYLGPNELLTYMYETYFILNGKLININVKSVPVTVANLVINNTCTGKGNINDTATDNRDWVYECILFFR